MCTYSGRLRTLKEELRRREDMCERLSCALIERNQTIHSLNVEIERLRSEIKGLENCP